MTTHKNIKTLVTPIIHPRFGNLLDPQCVVVPVNNKKIELPNKYNVFHIGVTGRCNANCRGCINTEITKDKRLDFLNQFNMDPKREAKILNELIDFSPEKEIVIALYGGEPLLEVNNCIELMENIDHRGKKIKFMLYTNGMLIDEVIGNYPNFFENIHIISISIDGQEKQHNEFRKGTDLRKIVKNIELIKQRYSSKILIWSTLREEQSIEDCFLQFMSLYENKLADYFFYHFAESKESYKDVKTFAKKYEQEFLTILSYYINFLEKGHILPIIHLNELLTFIFLGYKRGHTSCGVELVENLDIVGGEIYPCADLSDKFNIGNIEKLKEIKKDGLKYLVEYKKILECEKCGIEFYCGGRCPVQALMGSFVRTKEICQLLRLHVGIVMEHIEQIEFNMKKFNITPYDLYINSGYLSKLTDVIP